jgi:V8-like Glu-specific endopeptidase
MAIMGNDDRVLVSDVQSVPWKFVGRWDTRYPGNQVGISTGVLIGEKYALAAGHTFVSAIGVMQAGSTFTPAYGNDGTTVTAPFGVAAFDPSAPSLAYRDDERDIAVVRLQSNTNIDVKEIPGIVLFLNPAAANGETCDVCRLSR